MWSLISYAVYYQTSDIPVFAVVQMNNKLEALFLQQPNFESLDSEEI